MAEIKKSTKSVKANEIKRDWKLIDVSGKILGRVIPEITKYLQGKHKRNYVSYIDTGDNVVVINVALVKVTGKKGKDKVYTYYSGYPGGQKRITFDSMLKNKPEELIRHAVTGMLPKNKLRDVRLKRLHIYPGKEHPYAAKFS